MILELSYHAQELRIHFNVQLTLFHTILHNFSIIILFLYINHMYVDTHTHTHTHTDIYIYINEYYICLQVRPLV